jgi:membrane-associated phospholipid phosphatase
MSFPAVVVGSPFAFGGAAEALGKRLRRLHARVASLLVGSIGAFVLAGLMVTLGLFVSRALLSMSKIRELDANVPRWVASHDTPSWATASSVAYLLADIRVLVALVGLSVAALLLARRQRRATFLVLAALVELWSFTLTNAFVRWRDTSSVPRDSFPWLSFPAGRVAVAIAIYGGLAFVLSTELHQWWARCMSWILALAIWLAVAASLMYRGDHHLVDVVGGAAMGTGALLVALLAEHVAGVVAELRGHKGLREVAS